jgi:hypothetical protein
LTRLALASANLSREPNADLRIPDEVDGVSVEVEVVGEIRKRIG